MIGYRPILLASDCSGIGNVIIQDPEGLIFNDLTSAINYINNYSILPISNASFSIDTIRFSVQKFSDFTNNSDFLSGFDCRFIDDLGYIKYFPETFLNNSTYDNIIGNSSIIKSNSLNNCQGDNIIGFYTQFLDNCFNYAKPKYKNIIKSIVSCGNNCFKDYNGVLEIHGDIGLTDGQDFPNNFFDNAYKATIVVRKNKETSNSGNPDGDLANAINNGATVLFILP